MSFFSFKVCHKNTCFQSLRSLGLKLTILRPILQAFKFVPFYPQKWYLNYYVISTSDVTFLPQSFSQYGGQERREAARVVLHCRYTNPTKLLSESLDMFSSIFSHLPTRNSESANKLTGNKVTSRLGHFGSNSTHSPDHF